MSEHDQDVHYQPRLSRREALKWLAATAAWSGIPQLGLAAPAAAGSAGYGTDPVLILPSHGPWRRLLNARQLAAMARLSDLILPPGAGQPLPSEVGLAEFINEWVSAPYPKQRADYTLITEGLANLESQAQRRFRKTLTALDAGQLGQLLDAAAAEAKPEFFLRLRYLVVGGYYTTDVGVKEIGYVGNVVLTSYPGVPPHVAEVLEAELQRLGL